MNKYEDIINIATKRGLFFPSAEIYGSKSGFWTYGHLGFLLKRNWENLWRKYFLNLNDSYFEIEDCVLLPKKVFESSGHLEHFHDPMEEKGKVKNFNMMFDVKAGVKADEIMYLRPETAQSCYLAFKREFSALREKLPMGLAVIGKAFRNEISPRQGFLRLREFTQAELQIFFNPDEEFIGEGYDGKYKLIIYNNNLSEITCNDLSKNLPKIFVYHLAVLQKFYLELLKIPKNKFRFRQISEKEKAFYNKIHFDIELDVESFNGWTELGGLHYRTDHDLKGHQKGSGENLEISVNGKKVMPYVLELSFGVDRNVWALIDLNYQEEKERTIFSFPNEIAPFQIAVFPLVSNKKDIVKLSKNIYNDLRDNFNVFYDESGSIGRRYRRFDEIGGLYSITIDFDSLKNKDVTIRDLLTMKQIRLPTKNIIVVLNKLLTNEIEFLKAGKLIK